MAQKYLGDYFDIHCGGEDHIPVHHTNEIAQTEARCGTRLANFWMHGYFLLSNDAKMAKSAGEFLRLQLVDRPRLRPARLSLPVPHRALSRPAEFHLGRAGRRGHRARPDAQRRRRAARSDGLEARSDLMPRWSSVSRTNSTTISMCHAHWPSHGKRLRGDLPPAVEACDAACFRSRIRARARHVGAEVGDRSRRDRGAGAKHARRHARAKNWAEADRLRSELQAAGWEMEDPSAGYALKRATRSRPRITMKLATMQDGTRDGRSSSSHAISRTASRCPKSRERCNSDRRLARAAPALEALSAELNAGRMPDAVPFDPRHAMAPLPRAYQWPDGSAYVNHVELVRRARGATMPPEFWNDPLMYQGGSDSLLGAHDDIVVADEAWGIDFEAEVAVVTAMCRWGSRRRRRHAPSACSCSSTTSACAI